jgi:hypothetical protein
MRRIYPHEPVTCSPSRQFSTRRWASRCGAMSSGDEVPAEAQLVDPLPRAVRQLAARAARSPVPGRTPPAPRRGAPARAAPRPARTTPGPAGSAARRDRAWPAGGRVPGVARPRRGRPVRAGTRSCLRSSGPGRPAPPAAPSSRNALNSSIASAQFPCDSWNWANSKSRPGTESGARSQCPLEEVPAPGRRRRRGRSSGPGVPPCRRRAGRAAGKGGLDWPGHAVPVAAGLRPAREAEVVEHRLVDVVGRAPQQAS